MNYHTSTSNIILDNLTEEQFAKLKHPIQPQDETLQQQGHVGFLLESFPSIDNVSEDLLGADGDIEAATIFLSMQNMPPLSWATRPAISASASMLHASTSSGSATAASSSMARDSYAATLLSSSARGSAGAELSSEAHGFMQKGTMKEKMDGNSTKKSKSKHNNKKRPTSDFAVAVASIRRLTNIHTCRRKLPGKNASTNSNRACHLPITHNKDVEFDTFTKRLEDSGLFASTWSE